MASTMPAIQATRRASLAALLRVVGPAAALYAVASCSSSDPAPPSNAAAEAGFDAPDTRDGWTADARAPDAADAPDAPDAAAPPCVPTVHAPASLSVASMGLHLGCGQANSDSDGGDTLWVQSCEGVSEACVSIPVEGRYQLDIAAFGDGSGVAPTLQLGVDGVYTDDHSVAVEWPSAQPPLSTVILLAHLTAGPHRIQLRRPAAGGSDGGPSGAAGVLSLGTLAISDPAPPPAPDPVPDAYWNDVPLTWYPVDGLAAPVPFQPLPTGEGPAEPTVHVGVVGMPRSGDPSSWALNSNGYAEYTVVFPNPGPYDFDVWAYGDSFQGAPRLQLSIDGAAVGTVSVPASALTKYSFHAPQVTAGAHQVEVLFPNDLLGSGDRNLVVNAVDITEPGIAGSEELIDNGVGGQTGVGQYAYGPDSAGPPTGQAIGFDNSVVFSNSNVFPQTTRNVYVYVPTAVDRSKANAVMVLQDGLGYCGPVAAVLDHLIAEGAMPPTVAVCSSPGALQASTASCQAGDNDCERSFEYDSVNDRYFHFVVDELLPFVSQADGLTFTTDPTQRGIGGGSSGGIAAFTVGWFHPESFQKIYTSSASFADIRQHGGNQYQAMILANTSPPPLRVTMVAGTHDFDCFGNVGPSCQGNPHAWADANKRIAAALNAKGYAYRFQFGSETHIGALAVTTLPDDLRWLWSK